MRAITTTWLIVLSFRTGARSHDLIPDEHERNVMRQRNEELVPVPSSRGLIDGHIASDGDDVYHYLTACIRPYFDYVAHKENQFRIPRGEVKIIFDGGGGSFNFETEGKYPGYNPAAEFTFSYILRGLQDHCEDCRIQIHEGKDCNKPKIRYWNKSVEKAYNPWRAKYGSVYTSNRNGMAEGAFGMFDGYDFEEHKRRTVIIFNGEDRIGCGILRVRDLGLCDSDIDYDNSGPAPSPSGKGLTAAPVSKTLEPTKQSTNHSPSPPGPSPHSPSPPGPSPHSPGPSPQSPSPPGPSPQSPSPPPSNGKGRAKTPTYDLRPDIPSASKKGGKKRVKKSK